MQKINFLLLKRNTSQFFTQIYQCIDNCTQCTDYDGCILCDSGYYLYRAQCYLNNCPDGAFKDTSKLPKLECADCHPTCKTCNGVSDSSCLTCQSPRLFKSNQCLLDCGDRFYPTSVDCQPCEPSCLRCSGPLSTQCKACSSGRFLNSKTNQCVFSCPDQFYNEPSTNTCNPCDSKCYTCSGPTSSQCLTCEPPKMFLYKNKCDQSCPIYYFGNKNNQKCDPCISPCETCKTTETNCITCIDKYFLQDNVCQQTCKSRYFKNTIDRKCDACHVKCFECEGSSDSQCLSCDKEDGFLENKKCVDECSIGRYEDLSTLSCILCDPSCYGCKYPGNKNSCTKCSYPRFLNIFGQCNVNCPNRYYGDTSSNICRDCHPSCLLCSDSNSTSCTKCDVGKFLNYGRCLDKCPDGSFPNTFNQTCDPCYYSCTQCTDSYPYSCTACQNGRYFHKGQCIIECPNNFYKDKLTLSCQPCHASCLTCIGEKLDNCLTCGADKYLNNNQCVPSCLDGFYQDKNTNFCEICHPTCKTCFGKRSDNCSSCSGNRSLHTVNMSCLSFCPEGYYSDLTTNKCIPCHAMCKNCFGQDINQCSQCSEGLYLQNNQCFQHCEKGYFPMIIPNICSACHYTCDKCTGALETECYSCSNGRYKHGNLGIVCLSECPDAYYPELSTNTCTECDETCAMCDGSLKENCTKCFEKTYLYKGQCLVVCPSGYFASDLQGKCLKCKETCDTCDITDPNICLSCQSKLYLYQGSCYQSCPQGTFESSMSFQVQDPVQPELKIEKKTSICKNCFTGCKLCKGQTAEECLLWDRDDPEPQEQKIVYWIFVGKSAFATLAFFFGFYRDYKCKQNAQKQIVPHIENIAEDNQHTVNGSPENGLPGNDTPENLSPGVSPGNDSPGFSPDNSPIRRSGNYFDSNLTKASDLQNSPVFRRSQRRGTQRKRPQSIIVLHEFQHLNNSPLMTSSIFTPKQEPKQQEESVSPKLSRISSAFNDKTQTSSHLFQKGRAINFQKSGSDSLQLMNFETPVTNTSQSKLTSFRKALKQSTFGALPTSNLLPSLSKFESYRVYQYETNLIKKPSFQNKNFFLFFMITNLLIRYDQYHIRPLRVLMFYSKTMLLLWITSRLMENLLVVTLCYVIALQIALSFTNNLTRFLSQQLPKAVAIIFTLLIILIMFKVFWFFIPLLRQVSNTEDRDWAFLFLLGFSADLILFQVLFNSLQYLFTLKLAQIPPITWSSTQKFFSKFLYKDTIAEWLRQIFQENIEKDLYNNIYLQQRE